MTKLPTAEWCLYRASLSETYAEYLIRRDRLDVAKFHRKSAIIYRIAARVVDEGLATRLKWIILKANDSEDAARQIAKYLREGSE